MADQNSARSAVEQALRDAGLEWESPSEGTYVVTLPGTRKLSTTCSLAVGRHSLSVNAFVVRCPDENHAGVHRWLLERNTRLYGVSYAIDSLGDVYLAGRLPLAAVTPDEVDRLLGVVLENADGSFNTLLEMGFASAIKREYAWRTERGESTRNLDAFTHLTGARPSDPSDSAAAPPSAARSDAGSDAGSDTGLGEGKSKFQDKGKSKG